MKRICSLLLSAPVRDHRRGPFGGRSCMSALPPVRKR